MQCVRCEKNQGSGALQLHFFFRFLLKNTPGNIDDIKRQIRESIDKKTNMLLEIESDTVYDNWNAFTRKNHVAGYITRDFHAWKKDFDITETRRKKITKECENLTYFVRNEKELLTMHYYHRNPGIDTDKSGYCCHVCVCLNENRNRCSTFFRVEKSGPVSFICCIDEKTFIVSENILSEMALIAENLNV